ncbi:zinc finger CCCH domain-containing protein 15 [Hordeum vulgare]|uniref:Predicted protein n=1 Tax=Hordeum vulgare subsp. vulgare TaxID=112509 RepID=F2DY92_HORVV|nr:zinc finger CCCH domain-containing protein 15 homolog [Hordeum vulgare subsp. vulgare]XP_044971541.1 zinc finger CCCH domain-containing protein 15 homolog [Hordeum vulgare subsp. vulgare]KAE8770648.1 zinc finger CCCH domain-containing protein 15 [Hordeum vulgare]KAI5017658.1 hypothetical protein ZWY2020_042546 [Hordeum vulgare]BAK00064.1 predicted protein [Hordeum vulgare subsp. vulgare]BAK05187.1 predicted protein [Hordeum vulgare subsp. vulgare]
MGAQDEGTGRRPPPPEATPGQLAATAGTAPPPITAAQFLSWKQRKDAEEAAEKAEAARKRAADIASGTVQMNGRELFLQEPWVFDNNIY